MLNFLSVVFILFCIVVIGLFIFRTWLQCQVLLLQLPKKKKAKKVVVKDDLSEE